MTIKTTKPIPDFPTFGLLPKEETEAASFIKKHPEYDGRDTIIAILDTGVDPGAAGLQVTTEGKPKIIDLIDCTGAGDVITKTIVKSVIKDGGSEVLYTIQGLSGRTLIIDPDWNNPSDEFHIGMKRAIEIFPKPLVSRLQKERKQRIEVDHQKYIAEIQQNLALWEEEHPPSSGPSEADVLIKSDLEARLDVLKDLFRNYEDPGGPLLTDYRKERQYHTFSQEDLLNFSVNIYDEGNLVSTHGTHVAAIAAANFPDEPTLNGVAPGAQIVSLKIGDVRLGSMETGASLARAAMALVNTKADVANMSYGEVTAVPNYGHFSNLIRDEVIGKYGCIFACSAGNNGPALTTNGSPGGTTSDIISVGAYVSHAMVKAEYALLDSVPERAYTWSSRGPATDGDVGVTIYAPGGSSPNATGCIALLLSGLKAQNKKYTPYRIKNAIVNSAKSVDETFDVGMIQVEKAWDYLQKFYDRSDQDQTFQILIPDRPRYKRGIYLREANETSSVQVISVEVKPKFIKEIEPTSGENNTKKFDFESRLALISTRPWVRSPDFLFLGSQGRTFDVKVDPTQLTPERGPLFKIPITVAKPELLDNSKIVYDNLKFLPGHIERRFLRVPKGATFADFFTINKTGFNDCGDDNYHIEKKRFVVRGGVTMEFCLAQFWSSLGNSNVSAEIVFHGIEITNTTTNGGETVFVNGGCPFTPIRPSEMSLKPLSPTRDVIPSSRRSFGLILTYKFTTIDKNLSFTPRFPAFNHLLYDSYFEDFFAIIFDANKKVIGYLDIYPSTFKLESKGDYVIRAQVRHQSQPILEKLNNTVCLLDFNLSKKVSLDVYNQISDVFTSSKSTVGRLALEKGSRQALFIGSPNDYSSYPKDAKPGDILTGKLNFINNSANRIDGGQNFINLIIPPAPIKPKELIPSDNNHATAGDNSGGDPGKDSGSDDVDVAQSTEIPPPPIEKTKEEKAIENLNEAIRDVQIANLKKFPIDSSYLTDLLSELEDKYPKHLPLYQAKLEIFLETAKSSTSNTNTTELTVENAKIVIDTADELLSKIDLLELARYYGVKQETNVNESAKKIKKENDEKKKAAVLALRSKAQALMVLAQKAAATNKNGLLERFEETYKSLIQWLDSIPPTSDIKNLLVYISRERQAKRYGNALKAINKYFAENSLTNDSTRDYEKLFDIKFDILKEVGWTIWENNEKKWKLIRIPPSEKILFPGDENNQYDGGPELDSSSSICTNGSSSLSILSSSSTALSVENQALMGGKIKKQEILGSVLITSHGQILIWGGEDVSRNCLQWQNIKELSLNFLGKLDELNIKCNAMITDSAS
ncbi:1986_t:CDS:10 [Entrophospora sp. SA101]|nr:1986_t:CDS:10 [Entrophospora sp. SA101]